MPLKLQKYVLLCFVSILASCAPAKIKTENNDEPQGASTPFLTQEAEDPENDTNAQRITAENPSAWPPTPESEASGRAYVALVENGDYVAFKAPSRANAIVIRQCIPDAPDGGGITATLGLYINGERRQDMEMSSKHNWLYGIGNPWENGQSNIPTQFPHVFWDETRLIISGNPVETGDEIRLQKDDVDKADFYRIDLIELEEVPPSLAQPVNSLSVNNYGAGKGDADRDTHAFKQCVEEAKKTSQVVWVPAGTYHLNEVIELDGIQLKGAGMWYTYIQDAKGDESKDWKGNCGFKLKGSNVSVSDLSIDSPNTTYRSKGSKPFIGYDADGWLIENVWITHTNVGFWIGGKNGIIRNCRVRFTYADGINTNNGNDRLADKILITNNHVRGTGDDGIAILCHASSPHSTQRIAVVSNSITAAWWGSCIDLAGGRNHLIERNQLADASGFDIRLPSSYPMQALENAEFRYNRLIRTGSNQGNQKRGAIWTYPSAAPIHNLIIRENVILDPLYRAIHLSSGGNNGHEQEIAFIANRIVSPGANAIVIDPGAKGSGIFKQNVLEDLKPDFEPLIDNADSSFQLTQNKNSWQ